MFHGQIHWRSSDSNNLSSLITTHQNENNKRTDMEILIKTITKSNTPRMTHMQSNNNDITPVVLIIKRRNIFTHPSFWITCNFKEKLMEAQSHHERNWYLSTKSHCDQEICWTQKCRPHPEQQLTKSERLHAVTWGKLGTKQASVRIKLHWSRSSWT